MITDNKDIGDIYKESFEDFEHQPSPKVWKNINSQLDADNNLGKGGWAFNLMSRKTISLVAAVGILATAVILYTITKNTSVENENDSAVKITESTTDKNETTNDSKLNNSITESENNSPKSAQETQTDINDLQNNTTHNSISESNSSSAIKNSHRNNNPDLVVRNSDQADNINKLITEAANNNSDVKVNSVTDKDQSVSYKMNFPFAKSRSITLNKINVDFHLPASEISNNVSMVKDCMDSLYKEWKRKQFNNCNYKRYFTVYYSPMFTYVQPNLKNDDVIHEYPVIDLKTDENILSNYRIGIDYGRNLKKSNWIIEIGIAYNHTRSAIDYNFTYAENKTIITLDSIGSVFNPHDSSWSTIWQENKKTVKEDPENYHSVSNNTYHLIETEVLIGRPLIRHYRSSVIGKAGFTAGYLFTTNSSITTDEEAYLFEDRYPGLTRIQLSALIEADYNYALTDRLYLNVVPKFKIPISRFYDDFPVRKREGMYGIGIGLKYKF